MPALPDASALLVIDVISVKSPSTFTLYGSAAVPVPVFFVFLPSANTVFASFNCFTLTASLSSVPGAKFTILFLVVLSPMDKLPPEIVTAGVVVLGVSFNVMEELPLEILLMPAKFLFNLTVNLSMLSATTAMLPDADLNSSPLASSLLVVVFSVTPSPCTFTKEPNLCLFSVDSLLPVNFKPSSIVATSRLISLPSVSFNGLPLASFGTYTIRSD